MCKRFRESVGVAGIELNSGIERNSLESDGTGSVEGTDSVMFNIAE
jgi:hypothetical protein